MWLKFYEMLNFYKIIAFAVTVMLSRTRINKYCYNNKIKKLSQQINDLFNISNKSWKFCLSSFFNN